MFQKLGVSRAQLSVSLSNHKAVAYYHKHGWVDLGSRPGHPEVHLMDISIPLAT